MVENPPQPSGGDPVISTPDDLASALAEHFVNNAEAGNHAANDEMVEQILKWKRGEK